MSTTAAPTCGFASRPTPPTPLRSCRVVLSVLLCCAAYMSIRTVDSIKTNL